MQAGTPPPASAPRHLHNLPFPATQLIGLPAGVVQQLGEGLFAYAWAEGRAMKIPESAAYALSGEE